MMPRRPRSGRPTSIGQVLVLFVLFLLVLLGVSALGVDYVSWLLTDRTLQNYSDHAALAGASEFDLRQTAADCGSLPASCTAAREQAWKSLINDLDLRDTSNAVIGDLAIAALAAGDSPATGHPSGTYNGQSILFKDTIWVTTPPPNFAAYTGAGGRYAMNYGVVFVRVDRPVRAFFGGAIGINPGPRTGWATAGALPTDFALQIFCRNQIAPQNGVCKSDALSLDGAGNGSGGIWLVRGDIGSNESLKLTAQGNAGVVLEAGNMFLVNGACGASSWNCPQAPATGGGIADANPLPPGNTANMKNAFYIPPQPVPHFESPVNANTVSDDQCAGADATHLCIPWRDQSTSTPDAPGSWTCVMSGSGTLCGLPTVTIGSGSTPGDVVCSGQGGGLPPVHYYPDGVSNPKRISGDAGHVNNNNEWMNIDDDYLAPDPDTTATNPPADWVYFGNINNPGGGTSTSQVVTLDQAGNRLPGDSTVRFVAFKTFNGVPDNTVGSNPVTVQVSLLNGSGGTIVAGPTSPALTEVPELFSFNVASGLIADYNSLQLRITISSSGSSTNSLERGVGISWAGIEHPGPQPATPPMIPPGYYKSIDIPDGGCAVLDPTAEFSSLKAFQMPGIYRFGGTGNDRKVQMGNGAWLVGDGVTLVFDSDWPDSGSSRGLTIDAGGGLALNMMRDPTVTAPCAPFLNAPDALNYSDPLSLLPNGGGVCAAWGVDTSVESGVRPGLNAWHYCDLANPDGAHCVNRNTYLPVASYRGVTFYFTPDPSWSTAHASMNIRNRFEMLGGVGNLAYRGVNYGPYDDMSIQGQAGFNTAGQVLAWSAKFHGGGAFIYLDYPYDFTPASPYLLEPTVSR